MTSRNNEVFFSFKKDEDYSSPIPIKKSKQDIWYPEEDEMVIKFGKAPEVRQVIQNSLIPDSIRDVCKKYGGSGTDPYLVITMFSHKGSKTDEKELIKWILFPKHRTNTVYGATDVVEFDVVKHNALMTQTITEKMRLRDIFVKLVIWDYDKLSANDLVGMRTINITNIFRKAKGEEESEPNAVWSRFKVPIKEGPTIDDMLVADLEVQIEYIPNNEKKEGSGTFKLYVLKNEYKPEFSAPPKDTYPYGVVTAITVFCLYLGTGLIYFGYMEGWHTGQVIYLAIVCLTTIGYGDHQTPTNLPATYLFLSFYLIFALVTAGYALSTIIGAISASVEAANSELMTIGEEADDDEEEDKKQEIALKDVVDLEKNVGRCKKIWDFLVAVPFIVYGFIIFSVTAGFVIDHTGWFIKSSDSSDVKGFAEVLYYLIVTMTTVGFGDMFPDPDEKRGFWIVIFFLVIVVSVLSPLISAITQPILNMVEKKKKKQIFDDAFKTPKDFIAFDEDGDDDISQFEFLKTMLVKLQVAKSDAIEEILSVFREIDVDMSGSLKKEEIQDWYDAKKKKED